MEVYTGSICAFGFNYAPYGWSLCQGQLMPISQNTALFALLGVQFGGNGTSTFGLPDLQNSRAIGFGSGAGLPQYDMGENGGVVSTTMQLTNMPNHSHTLAFPVQIDGSANVGNTTNPQNKYLSYDAGNIYATAGTAGNYLRVSPNNLQVTDVAGAGTPFSVRTPTVTMNYCIALYGIFPQRQ